MIRKGFNISLSDKLAAARSIDSSDNNVVPPGRDTSSTRPKPIDTKSTTDKTNASGGQIEAEKGKADNATNPQKSSEQVNKAKDIQYEKNEAAEFPEDTDPRNGKPVPKKKGFMERLFEKKMESMLSQDGDRPQKSDSADTNNYPKEDRDHNKETKGDNSPARPNISGFDPSSIRTGSGEADTDNRISGLKGRAESAPRMNRPQFKSPAMPKIPRPKFKK